jgi:hypothetical protein
MAGQWMFAFAALAVSASVAAAPDASGQRQGGDAGQQSATGNGDQRSAKTTDDAVRLKQQAQGGHAVKSRYITGHVASATGDHIVIDGKTRGMVTLKVGDATKITVEGHATRADQIQPGSPVFAAYEGSGNGATATRVRVDPPRMSSGDASTGSPGDAKTLRGQGNGATTAK